MMWQMYVLSGLLLLFVLGYWVIRRQGKKIAEKEQQIEQIKAEAKAMAKELDNAEKRKQIEQANRRLDSHGVDDQLQSKGWFRD